MTAPLMKEAPSDKSQVMAFATSVASPIRRCGIRAAIACAKAGEPSARPIIRVAI